MNAKHGTFQEDEGFIFWIFDVSIFFKAEMYLYELNNTEDNYY